MNMFFVTRNARNKQRQNRTGVDNRSISSHSRSIAT